MVVVLSLLGVVLALAFPPARQVLRTGHPLGTQLVAVFGPWAAAWVNRAAAALIWAAGPLIRRLVGSINFPTDVLWNYVQSTFAVLDWLVIKSIHVRASVDDRVWLLL